MNDAVHFLWQKIAAHLTACEVVATALTLGFISHWPETIPKSTQDWWTWARATFQTALPVGRGVNPTQPASPAQPKQ